MEYYMDMIDRRRTRQEAERYLRILEVIDARELVDYVMRTASIIKMAENSKKPMDVIYAEAITKLDARSRQATSAVYAIMGTEGLERKLLELKYLEKKSDIEICTICGISLRTYQRKMTNAYIKVGIKLKIEILSHNFT